MRHTTIWATLYVLTLATSACMKLKQEKPYVDPELQPYIEQFVFEASLRGIDLSKAKIIAVFKPLDSSTLGECLRYEDNRVNLNRIHINVKEWIFLPEYMREQLVFHELGHCWLNLDHTNSTTPQGLPASIMNEYLFPFYYDLNRAWYIDELFY